MPDIAYVNGKIGPLRRAAVPVLDRGFMFADGAYEVLRTYEGRPFQVRAHLRRLQSSLRGLRIRAPMPRPELERLVLRLLARSRHPEARVYIQVTRGVAPRQHAFPENARPTLVLFVEALHPIPESQRQQGLRVITLPDTRWQHCNLKTIALLPNVLAKQRALDAGVQDAIFIAPDGTVREAASANVFVVHGKTLRTHPLGPEILPGVSRQVILQLARQAGMRVLEARFPRPMLYSADEVFLSSTLQEVMPVVRVDGRAIADGSPGPVADDLFQRFRSRALGAGRGRAHAGRARTVGRLV